MDSLEISDQNSSVYVQMVDKDEEEAADDIFDMKQQIFEIPLDDLEAMKIVGDSNSSKDIWRFAMLSREEEFIFQAINNEAAGENYQYELYYHNLDQEERITDMQSYAGNPVISVMVKQFILSSMKDLRQIKMSAIYTKLILMEKV